MQPRSASSESTSPFTLYVEGPRDRSILRGWAHRLMPSHVRSLLRASVILGGRRPARALDHFREVAAGGRAVCVLDRDDGAPILPCPSEGGIEFFTWSRRHIESYLLVPAAIRRALGLAEDDRRIERLFERELPAAHDEGAWTRLDAKRVLGPKGALPRALGRPLPLARIARATRESELHGDVHALFSSLRLQLGASHPAPIVSSR
ncbi:MAG: hypothetical protein OEW02_00425 [Myxococcales bacterium]|nr:hypothetical protein [Myxococcales bacterium]